MAVEAVEGFLEVELENVGTLAVSLRNRTKILNRPKEFSSAAAREISVLVERKESTDFAADAKVNDKRKNFTKCGKKNYGTGMLHDSLLR